MVIQMRLFLLIVATSACSTKINPLYCDAQRPCRIDRACDLVKHECALSPPDMAVSPDLAESPDLAPESDLAESPDLSEPDLAPPPDLTELPDLAPPPVYFNPDVQAILSTGSGGGCAKKGCHDASDGLYTPFLIPNPTTPAALHANYLSFGNEPELTVLQKLVASSGASHGGTMTAADRKPCATDQVEPCLTLERWYSTGALESAP